MKRRTVAIAGIAVVVVAAFFFVAPVVGENVAVCVPGSSGLVSLSYHFFNVGESYIHGQFYWSTHAPYDYCL